VEVIELTSKTGDEMGNETIKLGTNTTAGPILAGRPTAHWDSPELVGQIVAELTNPERSRQDGRQGIPLANAFQERPATAPQKRFSAVRARQLRNFRLDCNAGLTNSLLDLRGNVIHYRRSELGPAGVLLAFDDAGNEQTWLPAGGWIAGALFDRVYISCAAAAAGFATLLIADDPRQTELLIGSAPV
jgi:hypothetical protein